jgi:hypothetical protein
VPDPIVRGSGRLLPWLIAALSLAVGLAIVQPFTDVPVSFDTQATVVYFNRLISGVRLEQALTTTPKPFLTLVEGLAHSLTGDWRLIVWLTIVVQAACASLAVVLAGRSAGLVAGAAAGLVVAGMPVLIEDAAFGNAVPWALLGWLIAGLLLSGAPARPGLAGIALLVATLCRLETLVMVAAIAFALAWARFGPWPLAAPRPTVPTRAWLAVIIPLAALPVMLAHDWLLTGDPLFWLKVSQRYSDAIRRVGSVLDPVERITWFIRRYARLWPAIALALIGLAVLVRRREWGPLVGLAAMGPGIAAFIVLLAARGLYAPDRYALPVDLSLFLVAAIGFGSLVDVSVNRIGRSAFARRLIVGGAFGVAIGGFALARIGPFDPVINGTIADLRTLNENAARVESVVRSRVAEGSRTGPIGWIVPTAVRPRMAVDLGVPLTEIAGLSLAWIDPSSTLLEDGQIVFHDRHGDLPRGSYGVLETGGVVSVGVLTLRPLLIDPSTGAWVYEVMAGP